jgi:hypothetical protein
MPLRKRTAGSEFGVTQTGRTCAFAEAGIGCSCGGTTSVRSSAATDRLTPMGESRHRPNTRPFVLASLGRSAKVKHLTHKVEGNPRRLIYN